MTHMQLLLTDPEPVTRVRQHFLSQIHPEFGVGLLAWIKSKLWKLFAKDAYGETYQKTLFRTVTIEKGSVIRQVLKSRNDIERAIQGELKYCVVGRDHHYMLMQEASDAMFNFHDSCVFFNGQTKTVVGLTIVYVPWLNGLALLPEMPQ